jgi:hypothetical protein
MFAVQHFPGFALINSSPFTSAKEYAEAKAPIHTFANQPIVIYVLLGVSVLIFVYFIYASFSMKQGVSGAKSPVLLSLMLATSAFSLASYFQESLQRGPNKSSPVISRSAGDSKTWQPLILLGLVGLGGTTYGGTTYKRRFGRRRRRQG